MVRKGQTGEKSALLADDNRNRIFMDDDSEHHKHKPPAHPTMMDTSLLLSSPSSSSSSYGGIPRYDIIMINNKNSNNNTSDDPYGDRQSRKLEPRDLRCMGSVVGLLLFIGAVITMSLSGPEPLSSPSSPSYTSPSLLHQQQESGPCSAIFGKVFDEKIMLNAESPWTGGDDDGDELENGGGGGGTDAMVHHNLTFLTIPEAHGGGTTNRAEYYIYTKSVHALEGLPYLEYGILQLSEGKSAFSPRSNCRCELYSHTYLHGDWRTSPTDKNNGGTASAVFSFNTWDGGRSWIMEGHFNSIQWNYLVNGTTTTTASSLPAHQAGVLLPMPQGYKDNECIIRVNELVDAFAQHGVTLPKGTTGQVCLL